MIQYQCLIFLLLMYQKLLLTSLPMWDESDEWPLTRLFGTTAASLAVGGGSCISVPLTHLLSTRCEVVCHDGMDRTQDGVNRLSLVETLHSLRWHKILSTCRAVKLTCREVISKTMMGHMSRAIAIFNTAELAIEARKEYLQRAVCRWRTIGNKVIWWPYG